MKSTGKGPRQGSVQNYFKKITEDEYQQQQAEKLHKEAKEREDEKFKYVW